MQKVALFNYRCPHCKQAFSYPNLGDFSYGDFIFSGERGTVVAYAAAVGNPAWNVLRSLLPEPSANRNAQSVHADQLQGAFAHFADPINGQRLCNLIVCPHCQARNDGSLSGERVGFLEIPVTSHSQFMALPHTEQHALALAFMRAQLSAQADRPEKAGPVA